MLTTTKRNNALMHSNNMTFRDMMLSKTSQILYDSTYTTFENRQNTVIMVIEIGVVVCLLKKVLE